MWTGATQAHGYGSISNQGKQIRAHRVSYEIHHGAIPPGLLVLHKCDVPGCVNPDHLYAGTKEDNERDKAERGRSCRGERQHNAKLTEDAVIAIRAGHKAGISQAELSRRYGTGFTNIHEIVKGHSWKHLLEVAGHDSAGGR